MLVDGAMVAGGNEKSPDGFAGSSLDTAVEVGAPNENAGASLVVSALLPNENPGFGASFGAPKENAGAAVLEGADSVMAGVSSFPAAIALAGGAPKLNIELGLKVDVESPAAAPIPKAAGIDFFAGDASLAGDSVLFVSTPNLKPEGAEPAFPSSDLSFLNKTFTLPS